MLFSIILCYIIHKITIYVGNWLRIWEINTVDEAGNGTENETQEPEVQEDEVLELYKRIDCPESKELKVPEIKTGIKSSL